MTIIDENGSNLLHAVFSSDNYSPETVLVEYLVKEGVNINQVNKHGDTPLLKSLKQPRSIIEQFECLLKNGADVSHKNISG